MKKFLYIAILVVLFMGISIAAGTAQGRTSPGSGAVEKSIYVNPYFGLSMPIPDTWYVLSEDEKSELRSSGKKVLEDEDQDENSEEAESGTHNLLTMFKYPPGTSNESPNASMVIIAVNIDTFPDIKRGSDYLYYLGKAMQTVRTFDFVPSEGMYERTFGGVNFDVMDSTVKYRTTSMNQRYCTAIRSGYALTFLMTYKSEADLQTMQRALENVEFKGAGLSVKPGTTAAPLTTKPEGMVR